MNLERILQAVREEPDQPTLIVIAIAFEAQGYEVTINNKYTGSEVLLKAEENGELNLIPLKNGVKVTVMKDKQSQSFRVQFLDVDAVCFVDVDSPPVIYDPEFTTGLYGPSKTN